MAPWFGIASGGVALFAAVMHSYLGERYLLGPMFAPGERAGLLDRSPGARRMIRAVWHLPSFAWIVAAIAVIGLSFSRPNDASVPGLALAALLLAGSGLGNAIASKGRHFGWIALGSASALALGAAWAI